MAVHIRLVKNNIKRSSSYGKYFAKAVSQGEVTLKDLIKESLMAKGYSVGAVDSVISDLEHALKVKLAQGQTVVVDGIGRFSLRVESEGIDDPAQFSLKRHIKRIVCGFLPASHRTTGGKLSYNLCEDVKVAWQE